MELFTSQMSVFVFVEIILLSSAVYFFWTKDKLQRDLIKIKTSLSHVSIKQLFPPSPKLDTRAAIRLFDICKSIITALSEKKLEREDRDQIISANLIIEDTYLNKDHSLSQIIEYLQGKLADSVIASAIILKTRDRQIQNNFIGSSKIAKRLEKVIVALLDSIDEKVKTWGYHQGEGILEDFSLFQISKSYFYPIKNENQLIGAIWLGLKSKNSFLSKQEEFIVKTLSQHVISNLTKGQNSSDPQNIDSLLLGISHDLKAPSNSSLSVVRGFLNGDFGKVSSEQFVLLKLLESSLEEQQALVADILDFAQSKQGALDCLPKIVALDCLISEIITREKFSVEQKGLEFICQHLPNCKVSVDCKHAKRVLANLLSNATKYTNSGKVELSFSTNKSHLSIRVTDTGIGIPKDEVDKIFNSFSRCKNTEDYSGTGLGLAISKYLAELNGGFIHYQSNYPEGSIFEYGIPLASKIKFKKILVLEDDQATLRSHLRYLKDFAENIVAYQDATNAIRDLYKEMPNIIISDIYLGEKTSLALIPLIPCNTPLIIVSGNNTKNNEISALKEKSLYFLEKPLDRSKLEQVFEAIYNKEQRN